MTTRIEIAKAASTFLKVVQCAYNDGKALSYKDVVKSLQVLGLQVECYAGTKAYDKKPNGQKFVTSRTEKSGFYVGFSLNGQSFNGFSKDQYFSWNLTSFVANNLKPIELAKTLIP